MIEHDLMVVYSYSIITNVNELITGSFGDLTVTFHPQNVDGTYQDAIHSCQGTIILVHILTTRFRQKFPPSSGNKINLP